MGVTLYTARCRTERDIMVFGYTRPRRHPQHSLASAFSALAVGLRFLLFLPSSSPPSPSFGGAVELGMREASGLSSGLGARLGRGRSGVRIGRRVLGLLLHNCFAFGLQLPLGQLARSQPPYVSYVNLLDERPL
jgi:hypothetical protein